jgi:transposase-like protein
VRDCAASGIPVTRTCKVLGFSTQAFNKWLRNPVSYRDWDEAHLINVTFDIHQNDPEYGYRFISDEWARLKELERGNKDLRRANAILKDA